MSAKEPDPLGFQRCSRDDADQEALIEEAGSAWRPPRGGARIRRCLETATGYGWFEGAVRGEAQDDDPDAPRLHGVLFDDGDEEELNDSELRAAGRAHRRYASRRAAAAAPYSPFASSAGGGFTVLDLLIDPEQPTMAALRSAVETIAKADKESRPDVEDEKRPLYLKLPVRPAPFPPHAQRVLSRPLWLRHKKLTMSRGKDGERALMRSACALGGHEWIDAVPTRPEF